MTPPPARTGKQRRLDTLHRLEHDVDAWVATAGEHGGAPELMPLPFVWDGAVLLLATRADSPTGRNLRSTGAVRLAVGEPRDVVLVEGTATAVPPADLPEEDAEIFAGKTGFDPREEAVPFLYFRVHPHRIQAWREADGPAGRELMRGAKWLVAE
ncbi:pyridoxamine 5'-phosphate oxidase family protein [Streptomyces actuosus]|uniref:Pyridoxamine 5'-phosphate oxidase family protein n=1 Tax=Streptomyces actuosus TaxID=1885 RepID=A0ABS2VHV8_STRAS|nr:pyridoxamine 5'-phosphate oxidase family protein [Streptomyces actuosus]MBN0042675.1 pyridoxamine 5'-phosphate oxidase family protein [Streptomyces actuosus]